MFSSISWSAYFTVVAIATLLYYSVILFLYYRKDMIAAGKQYSAGNLFHPSQTTAPDPSYLELLIEQNMIVCDHIRAYLLRAASEQTEKETCIHELKLILGQYPMLNDTPFMGSINNLILKESDRNNIGFLPVEEVDALWVRAG